MSKIVVLNSGGFDSIALINYLHFILGEDEIYSLHFLYGANNEKQQLECVNKVCEKVGAVNKVIQLPRIDWTAKDFYTENTNEYYKQYLEYRNLIFLSYALSYAEAVGADKIYLATLKSHGYTDTCDKFFDGINSFSIPLTNIEVVRPFSQFEKSDLIYFVNKCRVEVGDYFSCDTPKDGKPCGECADCQDLAHIEKVLEIDHPHKVLVRNGYDYNDPVFIDLLANQKVTEVRLLINNLCQLKCKHCFYGFEDTKAPVLSKEKLYDVILQAEKLGVSNVHFSGKEPMFNDDILWYAHKIKEDNLSITFDIVTNGITIPKYAKELKECGLKKFYLSVDDVCNTNGVRSVQGVTDKALSVCSNLGIDVEIFIDLHSNNYNKIKDIVSYLVNEYGCVKSFYIRTIRNIGSASDMPLLSKSALEEVYHQVLEVSDIYKNIAFTLSLGIEYESVLFDGNDSEIIRMLDIVDNLFVSNITDNFSLYLEDCCGRYSNQVTVTPDGYLLGCASEVSSENYDSLSIGNIREHSLEFLIRKGKNEITRTCNTKMCGDCKKCSFLL